MSSMHTEFSSEKSSIACAPRDVQNSRIRSVSVVGRLMNTGWENKAMGSTVDEAFGSPPPRACRGRAGVGWATEPLPTTAPAAWRVCPPW
ncbi:hypothetical protein GCM10022241_22320 [Micrococcus endophyticus]